VIELTCLACSKKLSVGDDAAGKRGKCPQCGATVKVPGADEPVFDSQRAHVKPSPVCAPEHGASLHPVAVPVPPSASMHRMPYWLWGLAVVAAIISPFFPWITLLSGVLLLVITGIAFVPKARGISRRVLRLDPERRFGAALRLLTFGLVGVVLVAFSSSSFGTRAEQESQAAQVAKSASDRADRQRLANEADAQVQALLGEARQYLAAELAAPAQKSLERAMKVPHARKLTEVETLHQLITNSLDPDHVRAIMLSLSDSEFEQLAAGDLVPQGLRFGVTFLDAKAMTLAKAQTDEVAQARVVAAREHEERVQAIVDATMKANAAAEAERKKGYERRADEQTLRMAPLVLESWNWREQSGFVIAEGEVTNRSASRLENIMVVVSFYTGDNQFITSTDALVQFNPILPGQTTPFKAIATYNPRIASAKLAFKRMSGGTIGHQTR